MCLYVYIFVSVDDSGGSVYCVAGSCGLSVHKCMSVYVVCLHICVFLVCIRRWGLESPGWLGWLPSLQKLWPGVGLGGTGLNPSAIDSRIYRAPSRT